MFAIFHLKAVYNNLNCPLQFNYTLINIRMTEEPGQIPAQNIMPQLKEQPNFLAVRYNEEKNKKSSRAGGAYVPPHKLRAMQQKLMQEAAGSLDHQKMMWQLLRKSINGIVNKVNITNIQNVVIELFNENVLRGMGLLTKAIIKAQMASPNFTHVYAALIAVINTKLPEIGSLLITRVMIMFHRSFQRNNKIVCMATTKMIAHLINQRILGQFAGLQLLMILLMHATEDSVQIACDFMIEAGQVLSEVSPAAANAIFQRFKNLLHEAQIGQKAQYSIQKLFAIRKTGFKDHPGVIPQLDLVEAEDQITHNMDFQQELKGQQTLNFFKEDPNYEKNEQEWQKIKIQILGEQNIINLKQVAHYQEEVEEYNQQEEPKGIQDLTEQDLVNLRRTIYLAIQSTVNFEECAHKIIKMNITKGYESELIDMILECCMMERIYQEFFGLLSQRFCKIDDMYKQLFIQAFVNYYNTVFKLEVNKIRNLGKLYGHLFYTFSIDWKIMQVITLRQDTTTAAHRMFLKIIFRQIAQNLGVDRVSKQFSNPEMREYFSGLFPIGHPNDVRFAINYWTSIGLGKLTQQMRQVLQLQEQMIADRKNREQLLRIQQQMKQQQLMLLNQQKLRKQMEQNLRQIEQEQNLKYMKMKKQKEKENQQKERENRKYQKERQEKVKREKERKRKQSASESQRSQQNSSSSSSSSSSESDSQETPKIARKKQQQQKKPSVKILQRKRIQSSSENESQSSGISSEGQQSSKNNKQQQKLVKKPQMGEKKKNQQQKKRVSSSSSSSSSDSEDEKSSNSPIRKKRVQSKERSRKKPEANRRDRSSSQQSSRKNKRRRNRSRSKEYRRR